MKLTYPEQAMIHRLIHTAGNVLWNLDSGMVAVHPDFIPETTIRDLRKAVDEVSALMKTAAERERR